MIFVISSITVLCAYHYDTVLATPELTATDVDPNGQATTKTNAEHSATAGAVIT